MGTSGTVRGEGGNVLTYSDNISFPNATPPPCRMYDNGKPIHVCDRAQVHRANESVTYDPTIVFCDQVATDIASKSFNHPPERIGREFVGIGYQ